MVPFQSILCPTDFSECARAAFDLACSLARVHKARLIVAHVLDAEYDKHSFGGVMVEVRPADYPHQQLKALQKMAPPCPDVSVEHVLMQGQLAEAILQLARDTRCDLIVMGTHGLSGFRRLVLGSIAEQVLRQAGCPVVTAKVTPSDATKGQSVVSQLQTILHPTDFSDRAREAFHLACLLARDQGARLVVLHVAPPTPVSPRTAPLSGEEVGTSQAPLDSDKEVLKEKLRRFAVPSSPVPVEYEVAEGNVDEEVLAYSHKIGADLIVMGTHGRTGLSRLLMGSVAEQVVRKAHCPVLTAKVPFVEAADPRQPRSEESAALQESAGSSQQPE